MPESGLERNDSVGGQTQFVLAPDLEARLRGLVAQLLLASQTTNLTAIRDADEAWTRHILDSLEGLKTPFFDADSSCIDVGAGAGFPGLPLAITRPQTRWTFLEATGKKCRYIEAMSEQFGLGATVLHARAEETGQNKTWRAKFDVATARAVGSLSEVLELCLPLVKVGGHVLLWRGKDAPEEAAPARHALYVLGGTVREVRAYTLPSSEALYHLVTVEKTSPTARFYPRRDGLPKSKPL